MIQILSLVTTDTDNPLEEIVYEIWTLVSDTLLYVEHHIIIQVQ